MYGHIYCITNKVNGKQYVGQTIQESPSRRGRAHFQKDANGILRHALKKYGREAFVFEVIGAAVDQEFLDLLEEAAVNLLGTISPCGYNMRNGGKGGGKLSAAMCEEFTKQRNTPEYRLSASKKQKIVQNRPDVKIRQRLGVLAAYARPGFIEKKNAATKVALAKPEIRQKLREARRKILATPGFREKHAKSIHAAKERISASIKKLKWITDGINNRRVHKELPLPEGWRFGRSGFVNLKAGISVKGTRWINNGKTNKRVPPNSVLPDDWVYGQLWKINAGKGDNHVPTPSPSTR